MIHQFDWTLIEADYGKNLFSAEFLVGKAKAEPFLVVLIANPINIFVQWFWSAWEDAYGFPLK